MSILDQLRDEANNKQESEFSTAKSQETLEQEYQTRILPKMQKTFTFLKEIIEHLNYLQTGVEIKNYSHKYPQIGALTQKNYAINTDNYGGFANFDRIMQVNVNFACVGKGIFHYKLEGHRRIEQEVAFLHSKNLPFDWNQFVSAKGTDTATFKLTREIPVRFRFEVDLDNTKIKLLIYNHDDFSTYNKVFAPEEVNDALLDELIRYMLRKDSEFIRLDINHVDKQRIQKEAEDLQLQQAKWLEEINIEEDQVENEGIDSEESHFFNRLKSSFGIGKKS